MQKLPVAIALASLVVAAAVTKMVAKTPQPETFQGVTANPIPPEITKQMDAALVPYGEAVKKATELLNQGKFVEAEAECRRALTLVLLINGKPWYGEEVPLLGDILLAQGRNQEALDCYLRIVTSSVPDNPEHPHSNIGAALAYCRLGNFKMAKRYFPRNDSPEWHKVWRGGIEAFEASLLYSRAGEESSHSNYRMALFYLKQAEKLAPPNTKWFLADMIGDAMYDLHRYDDAVTYYRRAMELGGAKVSYEHRMRVEMFDLRQKQQKQKAAK